jgi:Cdc6-like AAA superfamily ATPase
VRVEKFSLIQLIPSRDNMKNNQLVYALYGAGNTGKTKALRLLARKLEEKVEKK